MRRRHLARFRPRPRRRAGRLLVAIVLAVGALLPTACSAGSPAPPPLTSRLSALKLISYYPSTAAWTNMWAHWNPGVIDHDFGTVKQMGANVVRIFVQPDAVGFPTPSPAKASELARTIALAAGHGLAVQLTLFDWWNGYRDTSGSDRWASALLTPYRDDPRLVFVEVKNEVDPADPVAMAWTRHEIPVVRSLVGTVPVTVSVAGTIPLAQVRELKGALGDSQPDFYDIHYYGSAGAARATFAAARAAVAPYPLFVGESGRSSDDDGGDAEQDLYLRTVEWAARSLGLPDVGLWILRDISPAAVPGNARGDPANLAYGLLRTDGSAKPVAASVHALFAEDTIGTGFDGDFTDGTGGMPDDWQLVHPVQGTASWDPTTGHAAPGSVVLRHTGTPGANAPAFTTVPVVQPTASGQAFRLTAWAEGSGATGTTTIAIDWLDANDRTVATATSSPLATGTTAWRQLSVTSTAPPGAAYAQISLDSVHDSGAVWFDDVAFAPVLLSHP